MFYLLERIEKICGEIEKNIYCAKKEINDYLYAHGQFHDLETLNKINPTFKPFHTNDLWGGKDEHGWFKCSVEVPKEFEHQTIALDFHTFEEGWDATNPQFILYINGELIQGLDINHREVILTNDAKAGDIYEIDLHAYAGMLADTLATLHGQLVVIDMDSRELYWNLKVPCDVCKELDEDDINRIDMINCLNEAINLLDLRKMGSKEYHDSVIKTNQYLNENFYNGLCHDSDIKATCVGHTHIDVAWMWTVAQTREKVCRSFSTVLKLMDEYPEYIFMSSQPQLYKMLKEDYPEVYAKLKEKVKEGRFEPEGAMWLEADCNVTSGESLIRQILHGKRFFKQEFNVDNEILWLPDVFGYSAALPQILKKSGINYFMTTKIAWNQFNKIPNDTFMWQGIDGSEVLTHFITTTSPGQDRKSFFTTYNGHIQPDAIMGAWRRYQNKNINKDVLVSFGWGDGGGGPTKVMLENARRLAKGIPGAPQVQMGTSKDYFKRLEKTVKDNPNLNKWVGELYLEYHRGTYTSMARNKRDNRLCEQLYESVEKVSTMAKQVGFKYSKSKIYNNWETILLNQFHDIIPGSSIKEVYDVSDQEYQTLISEGKDMLSDAIDYLVANIDLKNNSIVVFNTLGMKHSGIVEVEIPNTYQNVVLKDSMGNEILTQRIDDEHIIFRVNNIKANSYQVYEIVDKKVLSSKLKITTKEVENDYYQIQLDDKGQFISIYSKEAKREVLKPNSIGNQLIVFEDKPMGFDNWDIDIYYKEKSWIVDNLESIRVIEEGNIRSSLELVRRFEDSLIKQKIHFYADSARIDFETYVDWQEKDMLLKVAFPVDINTTKATYEIQYGNVERNTHNNTSWDVASFEVCAHKWADVSEADFGVALMNNCKYGYDIKENNMRLTLLKSSCYPNAEADKEEHYFTYSIYPHMHDYRLGNVVGEAYDLNVNLLGVYASKHQGQLPLSNSYATLDADNVIIEVIKEAEDDESVILRMYEAFNKRTNTTLTFNSNIVSLYECDLMENNLNEVNFVDDKVELEFKPFEIKTLKVKLM